MADNSNEIKPGRSFVYGVGVGIFIAILFSIQILYYFEGPSPFLVVPELGSTAYDGLMYVTSYGYGCSKPTEAIITRGTTVFAKKLFGNIPGVPDTAKFEFDSTVKGVVGSGTTVGGSSRAKLDSSALSVSETRVVVVVCGDASLTPASYKVCIGENASSPVITGCKS